MLPAALVLGAGFASLAGLVAAGSLSGVDAYVLRHWTQSLTPARAAHEPALAGALVPFYGLDHPSGLDFATAGVTLPGYILVSCALVAGGVWLLARRGLAGEAATWAAVFVAGNVVEVVSKHLLTRPPLRAPSPGGLVHVVALDASYPSGHALRIVLVAALVVRLRPRLWPAAVLWVAAAAALLVASRAHTVTDVAGGMLLAGFLLACVRALPEHAVTRPA